MSDSRLPNDRVLSLIGIASKAGKTVSGEFAVEQSIKELKAQLVIVAKDASDNTKKHFNDMCVFRKIPIVFYGNKEQLGRYTGGRYRANVAVNDKGFADSLKKLLQTGEK